MSYDRSQTNHFYLSLEGLVMSVLELFCDVDDLMLSFAPQWKANQLAAGKQRAARARYVQVR